MPSEIYPSAFIKEVDNLANVFTPMNFLTKTKF
jgi:hypothetical protein